MIQLNWWMDRKDIGKGVPPPVPAGDHFDVLQINVKLTEIDAFSNQILKDRYCFSVLGPARFGIIGGIPMSLMPASHNTATFL